MESNSTVNTPEPFFTPPYVVIPAILSLICFICTVVSMTVAGFICFRDREAKDENEITIKRQREDEFVSKAISLFYNIRTFHVFRIKDIVAEKNENRPAIVSSKEEIIKMLQFYGVFLSDKEDRELSSLSDIFEIDADALLYLELERFSKALAINGEETMRVFTTICQDGVAFQNLFFSEKKAVYEKDLIYTIYREMRQVTDLFILLLTGIDAGYIKSSSLPKQFKMCFMMEELSSLEEFFYNYYRRLYSRQYTRPVSDEQQSWQPLGWLPRSTSESSQLETGKPIRVPAEPSRVSKFRKAYNSIQAAQRIATKKIRPTSPKQSISTDIDEADEYTKDEDQSRESIKQSNSDPDLREPLPTSLVVPDNQPPMSSRRRSRVSSQFNKPPTPRLIKNPWSMRKRGKLYKKVALEKDAFTYMVFKVLECLKGNTVGEESFHRKEYNEVDRNFIL